MIFHLHANDMWLITLLPYNLQFIASTPTLFPPEYVQEFQYCFDRAPAVPFEEIQTILREELGRPIDTVFEYIDPTPVASASIAQVHEFFSFVLRFMTIDDSVLPSVLLSDLLNGSNMLNFQVHGAKIRDTGEDVVIKVLKPGIEDILVADLNFIYIAARILEFLSPDLSRASLVKCI